METGKIIKIIEDEPEPIKVIPMTKPIRVEPFVPVREKESVPVRR